MNKFPALYLTIVVTFQANALPNTHSHERPGNFSATCATYGVNDAASTTKLTWQSEQQQLSIVGNNIMADEGMLSTNEHETYTVHYVTTYHHNETGKIKVLHLTIRRHHEPNPDIYHGEPWQTIRSFRFEIREDGTGYIQTYEAADIEGILTVNSYTYLGECDYSGSYAETGQR